MCANFGFAALATRAVMGYCESQMSKMRSAKFKIGEVVRHRLFPFRGVVFDIDPEFNNTEEWYQSIPAEVRPRKDQPFYHLLAESGNRIHRLRLRAEPAARHVGRAGAPSASGGNLRARRERPLPAAQFLAELKTECESLSDGDP
jgi:hypothetical protein